MTKRRPLALCAAAALGLGSLFIASPALAEDAGAGTDPTALASAAAADIQEQKGEESVVGYGANTVDGEPVVLVSNELKGDADQLNAIAAENGAKVALISPATTDAATDVVGGAGYVSLDATDTILGACSLGFSAWSPAGQPALITAGHCQSSKPGMNGVRTGLTLPSAEPAVGGEGFKPNGTGILGDFGFAQFGGPGNTDGAENDPTSTDIAVIDVTDPKFKLRPEVTDWTTAAQDDLAASTTDITGVALPKSGTVSKSGRTTGVTTGSTTVDLPYTDGSVRPTEILDGYMQISGRWVRGFIGGALTEGGDSGGAVFQGENAVGVVSGGPEEPPARGDDWAWYTLLQPALELTGGYQVAIALDAPVVDSPANNATVEPGSDIVVSVPAPADELAVSYQEGAGEVVPVQNGKVTLQAPEQEGTYTYSLSAKKGFNSSETVQHTITVADILPRPVINDQELTAAEGADSASTTITGTGEPGATVTVNGIWEATVGADGKWEYPDVNIGIGVNTLRATQTLEGETSNEATGTITVKPAAAKITSVDPNQTFAAADAPSSIAGTGLAGANIKVTLNGKEVGADLATADAADPNVVKEDGTWSVDLGAQLGAGTYAVSAVQSLNGASSAETSLVFTVEAAPVDPVDPTDPTDPTQPTDPVNPTDPTQPTDPQNPGGELPLTGSADMLPFGITAGALLLLGVGALALTARRLKTDEA
ncbi:S1 family peptidase [Leucobacter sp. wl10]|uniref:S1 family peptidase n=1 Tax=Leucobacter sp. wl10 TaxID=2304677 RepID=UPI000E5C572C|nr:trypsin-like serine protease [Leucobacter sp. wl10]RGE19852.1 hypothetical protein D1J51_10835 [Leucobacter sp. wl10]